MLSKEEGSLSKSNECMNSICVALYRSSNFNISAFLNNGSVCELYLAFEISLIAFFYFLITGSRVPLLAVPHDNRAYIYIRCEATELINLKLCFIYCWLDNKFYYKAFLSEILYTW